MANEMLTWAKRQVFNQFGLTSSERFVLMTLADMASWNEETGEWSCFPMQKHIVDTTALGERTVKRALARMAELGLVTKDYRRHPKTGLVKGRLYILHPEVVDQPIAMTVADRITPEIPEQAMVAHPEIPGQATMAHPQNPGQAAPSDAGEIPEFSGSATVAHPEIAGQATVAGGGATMALSARGVKKTRARINHQLTQRSSSSSSQTVASSRGPADGAARVDDEGSSPQQRPVPAHHQGVNLEWLASLVRSVSGWECSDEQLAHVIDVILARSRRKVSRPQSFIEVAIKADPEDVRRIVEQRFGSPESPAVGATTRVGAPSAGPERPRRALCPIEEHARDGHLAVNCPACRKWREYPPEIPKSVYVQLDADVQVSIDQDASVVVAG